LCICDKVELHPGLWVLPLDTHCMQFVYTCATHTDARTHTSIYTYPRIGGMFPSLYRGGLWFDTLLKQMSWCPVRSHPTKTGRANLYSDSQWYRGRAISHWKYSSYYISLLITHGFWCVNCICGNCFISVWIDTSCFVGLIIRKLLHPENTLDVSDYTMCVCVCPL